MYTTDAPASSDPEAIRPITVAVPDGVLDDLQARLARSRLPDQIPGTGWEYGTDGAYLEELLAYWQDGFDWRAQERRINEFDHFVTEIDGVDVHFIHQRSDNPDAIPLLLTHGWPGSFIEFLDLIGPLTDPAAHGGDAADAFHVVVPSLPGFGLSGKTAERGYSPERISDIEAALMERLGYDRYGAQGGDWGAIIGRSLAGNYPDNVIGFHSNFILGGPNPAAGENGGATPEEMETSGRNGRGLRRGKRLSGHSGHEAADGRSGAQRLASRARRLDRGEVPRLERQRRERRERVHQRPDADQHHPVLGDGDDHVVGAHLLRVTTHPGDASLCGTSRCPRPGRSSRRKSTSLRAHGPRPATTSSGGRSCREVDTSRRSRSPSFSWTTCVRSSES